jgi:hypothetical protein
MDKKSNNSNAKPSGSDMTFPVPPNIPSGKEVYDTIMNAIEPDLTTSKLPLLKEKYKDETQKEASNRAARYDRAFKEYDTRYQQYIFEKKGEMRIYRHNLFRLSEDRLTADESNELDSIASQISQS